MLIVKSQVNLVIYIIDMMLFGGLIDVKIDVL